VAFRRRFSCSPEKSGSTNSTAAPEPKLVLGGVPAFHTLRKPLGAVKDSALFTLSEGLRSTELVGPDIPRNQSDACLPQASATKLGQPMARSPARGISDGWRLQVSTPPWVMRSSREAAEACEKLALNPVQQGRLGWKFRLDELDQHG